MRNKTILLVLISLTAMITPLFAQKIVGYLPYYRGYNSNFDYTKYTHIHYFAIWPAADGSFIYPGSMDSLSMANQFHSIANEAQPGGTKMVMTFGGTSENGSANYITMASNATARANFVANVEALCNSWSIDGVDIDWEWNQPTNTTITDQAYLDLMTDLRTMTTNNNLTLSVDVSPSSWNGKFSPPAAVDLADYVNVMSYGYNGAWASTAAHHSPMDKIISIGLKYWQDKGISAAKLNLGTAFYGIAYEGTTTPGAAFTSSSIRTYIEVANYINSGYTVVEDNTYGTYCYSTTANRIIFYDSPLNTAYKMKYTIDNNYGGVIIWEIGEDTDDQTLSCAIYNEKSVVSAIESVEEANITINYSIDSNELIITFETVPTQLKLVDIKGNVVFQKEVTQEQVNIEIQNFSSGLYFIQTLDEEAQRVSRVYINN